VVAETRSIKNATARLTAAGGVQLGDLPPYDAHILGGVNCVRGYDEGAMGTARHWLQLGAELESPQFWQRFSSVAFVDAGSDLNTGQTVVGDPAGTRGKPGKGLGYGIGLRMTSPMGPLRLDYAWCDRSKWREEGRSTLLHGRLHIGIGTRFRTV
jgi:outer membrane protein insertion porin family